MLVNRQTHAFAVPLSERSMSSQPPCTASAGLGPTAAVQWSLQLLKGHIPLVPYLYLSVLRCTNTSAIVVAGLGPKAAVERSRRLLKGNIRAIAIPLVLLTLAPRAVLTGRNWLLAALPPRLWTQVSGFA